MSSCNQGRGGCFVTSCNNNCVGSCISYGCNDECSTCQNAANFNPNWTCYCHNGCGAICWSAYSSYLSSDGTCGGCSGISINV